MKKTTSDLATALKALRSLDIEIVERCPEPTCTICEQPVPQAA